ncbi:hypothetical protein SAMN05444366_2139 [Flavobacterium saccharophilum]|uniref:Uncharacterized protein n=1 Tax=Flavobacterium saccharophilum TaxID=29534 RepID=A0A1M7FJL1_9FLAO|nr:hypothetical protein SAMN05444366_2139 [Flavobacterium saccharophilum]
MKIIIYTLLVLAYVFFLCICFLWLITYGSGHNIPEETNRWLIYMTIFSVLFVLVFSIMKKKLTDN